MAENERVVILGGHGKIALLTAPKLVEAGWQVDSLIRNPDHREEVAATGAEPVLLDIEEADVDQLAEVFGGASAVVFAAGAGGGNPARTQAVDLEAAVRSMDAAQQALVPRYVMVSYIRSETDIKTVDPESSFFAYAKAKHHADEHLRSTELDYTILGPGSLSLEPATKMVRVIDGVGADSSGEAPPSDVTTSRENVAEVILHVLTTGAGSRRTYNFSDGDTELKDAIL